MGRVDHEWRIAPQHLEAPGPFCPGKAFSKGSRRDTQPAAFERPIRSARVHELVRAKKGEAEHLALPGMDDLERLSIQRTTDRLNFHVSPHQRQIGSTAL